MANGDVLSSPDFLEPGIVGIRRPVLLLPKGIADRLQPSQSSAILAHECCHVRRRDNLAAGIHMLVEALYWFHPLVWWIETRLVDERERACDEEVLRTGSAPDAYAEGILSVCRFYVESQLVCASGVTGSDLKRRIEAIMKNRAGHPLTVWKKLILATTGVMALAAPVATGVLSAPPLGARSQATAADRPAFEVASVKPNTSRGPSNLNFAAGDRFTARNMPLRALIRVAFRLATIPGTRCPCR
jgi:bla regulator protein BlaR1